MASTNKTTNYELSQYIGTDKPTYLSDYNGDMYKIDAQMKVNADNVATAISSASTATSTANTANSTANSALSTAQSASSTATSASTTASNAQTTANSALSTATTAQSTANQVASDLNAFEQKFNFTDFDDLTVSVTNGTLNDSTLKCATNSDGSIGKLYGRARVGSKVGVVTITANTNLRPSSQITIQCLGTSFIGANNSFSNLTEGRPVDVTISTNGDISISSSYGAGTNESIYLYPCLLFMEDFGDTPTPESN